VALSPTHLLVEPTSAQIAAAISQTTVAPLPDGGLLVATFARASTRTRVSACRAARALGLDFLEIPWGSFYGNPDVHPFTPQNAKAELRSLKELGARALIARIGDQQALERLADSSPIPVISGATSNWHPLQALADLAVLARHFPQGRPRIAIIGNGGGPVTSSLIASAPPGYDLVVVCPRGFEPLPELAERRAIRILSNPDEGVAEADVIYLDEWVYRTPSADEKKVFGRYRMTEALVDKRAPKARIMHCLPHAEEVEESLLFGRRSLVWEQVSARTSTLAAVLGQMLEQDR